MATEIAAWLAAVMADFDGGGGEGGSRAAPAEPSVATAPTAPATLDVAGCAERVFEILGARRFTHLSRSQARPYRDAIVASLLADARAGLPLRFRYDLGPGYHASLNDDFTGLRFAPGLGELLALRQIRRFADEVQAVWRPGVRFGVVIDDLCAWATNDIATVRTAGYIDRLVDLVARLGLRGTVVVQAESALADARDYARAVELEPLPPAADGAPTAAERENVSRFVGRACGDAETLERVARYRRAQAVSERLLAAHGLGVPMTQRASPASWGFRSFPGGDSRLQCGEVDLLIADGAAPRPALVTRTTRSRLRRWPIPANELPAAWPLPPGLAHAATPSP